MNKLGIILDINKLFSAVKKYYGTDNSHKKDWALNMILSGVIELNKKSTIWGNNLILHKIMSLVRKLKEGQTGKLLINAKKPD